MSNVLVRPVVDTPPEVRLSSSPFILLDLKDVAIRLRVHYSTAREFVLTGKLQGLRLGGRRKIQVSEEALAAFIEAAKIGPDVGPIAITEPRKTAQIGKGQTASGQRPHQWRQRFARK